MSRVKEEIKKLRNDKHKEYKYHEDSGLFCRDGDVGIIFEQSEEWSPINKFNYEGKVVLDIGGHMGCAAWHFLKLGVRKVVSVEPDPSNIKLFKVNHGKDKRVKLIEAAVVNKVNGKLPLYLGRTYPASNSLHEFRGRKKIEVETISFKKLLKKVKPNIIKCDIEGWEYELDWRDIPDSVTEILLELHQFKDGWLSKQKKLDKILLKGGFKHLKAPIHKVLFHKTCTAAWTRRNPNIKGVISFNKTGSNNVESIKKVSDWFCEKEIKVKIVGGKLFFDGNYFFANKVLKRIGRNKNFKIKIIKEK